MIRLEPAATGYTFERMGMPAKDSRWNLRVLADRTVLTLSEPSWERFVAALERPPRVPPGLRELFSRPSVFESPSK